MGILNFRRLISQWKALPFIVAIFFLALIYLWPLVLHSNDVPMTGIRQITDFLGTHLPYSQYIHNMWAVNGYPPMWNSSMLSGMPLVADPLAGYFYPPNWLTFLFPTPAAFNLLFVLHLAWTGLGMFLFLRSDGIRPLPALFGAAAWMGTPKLIGYVGGGQVSSVFALAWYPWLLLGIDNLTRSFHPRHAALSAGILAIIILTDIRWGIYAGLLALIFLISRFPYKKANIWDAGKILVLFLVFVVLLTAVLTFPLAELMMRSDRMGLDITQRAIYSLDANNLIGILTPQFGIMFELITYVGLPVVILALLGLGRRRWFWAGMIGFAGLFSIGQNSPLFLLFSSFLPGLSLLRVPSRLWFFVAIGCAILSAYGLDRISNHETLPKLERWFRPMSFAVSLFAVLLAVGMAAFFPPLPSGILVFSIITPLTLCLLNMIMRGSRQRWDFLLLMLMMADLLWVNSSIFRSVPLDPVPEVVRWLETQPGLFRVYSPSYSLPPPHWLQTAEGVNPLHLQTYGQFMADASRIRIQDYSVSVPGIYLDKWSDPEFYKAAASPDFESLGKLNVKYIVTSFPINISSNSIRTYDHVYLYTNPEYRERAWINGPGSVEITNWSPDRIVAQVETSMGGLVVFSEIDYPGWKATVDGQAMPIEPVENLLRGVRVPPGKHEIVLHYVPFLFFFGLTISILGWTAFFFVARARNSNRKSC